LRESTAAVNKLSTGLVSQSYQSALSGVRGECVHWGGRGTQKEVGRKEKKEEKKARARGNEENESCAVAVRHGVIKASHGFLWVKEEKDGRENGD